MTVFVPPLTLFMIKPAFINAGFYIDYNFVKL